MSAAKLPSLLQSFFTVKLLAQRRASEHTVASYRDCFRLLLGFTTKRLGKQPSTLSLEDLDAALISQFLDHLECDRGNSVRSRNVRLAALHSFFRYVAMNEPAHLLHCQRPRHPQQAVRARASRLPRRGRHRGAAEGPGPQDVDRAS